MYQVVQKKFNLSAVVICNCFISPVNIVLCKMFSFCSGGPCIALSLIHCVESFCFFIIILRQSQHFFNKMFCQP